MYQVSLPESNLIDAGLEQLDENYATIQTMMEEADAILVRSAVDA